MSPISFPAELIALVFDELEAIGRDESLGDFARLARSYRAFAGMDYSHGCEGVHLVSNYQQNQHSIDCGGEQSTLAPLIRCMPDDLWIQEEDKLVNWFLYTS